MKLVELFQTIKFMPMAHKHLLYICEQLTTNSYEKVLHLPYKVKASRSAVAVIVKSYFWSCRLLPDCQCLPRSIALFQHLQAAGYDVQHKFGINRDNGLFKAHAWVEYNNKPLNEHPNLLKRFKVLQKHNKLT